MSRRTSPNGYTQALRLAANEDIPVHVVTVSGHHIGSFHSTATSPQRRIRQFKALVDDAFALSLAKRLVMAKLELQLKFLLRATRKDTVLREATEEPLRQLRNALKSAAHVVDDKSLLGCEGAGARAYFAALPRLVPDELAVFRPDGRSRRPPADRFNALLSFGYGLLHKDVDSTLRRIGLDPSFGFYHRARSAAYPLSLDVMELFRVPLVDMTVLAAVNRRTFDADADFAITGKQVWLSETGRQKLIEALERRKSEELRHDVVGYSLSYARLLELECRLLEKEWTGEPGLFARLRIR
jgi:CRISPR-associated protein Cas1